MRTGTGLALCLWPVTVALWPAGALAGDLIGRIVPPYPAQLRDIGGSCMTLTAGYEHICDYSVGVLADSAPIAGSAPATAANDDASDTTIRYVVAGRMAGRDGKQARWLITDAVPYPTAQAGYHLQVSSCRVAGRDDPQVIAVVRGDLEGELLTDVLWARRVDLPAGTFTTLDPKSVDCINEAYLGL